MAPHSTPQPPFPHPLAGVIFDLDGTLARTNDLIFASFNHVSEKYLQKKLSPGEIIALFGPPEDGGLRRLLGRNHQVLTAVAVVERDHGRVHETLVESTVRMREATIEDVRAYVATGEPLDKAGAYALQGEGRRFVDGVSGSETNVIGLPLDETLALLRAAGWAQEP